MPEMAASGLWSTSSDFAQIMITFMDSHKGNAASFIRQRTAQNLMTRVNPRENGLGL